MRTRFPVFLSTICSLVLLCFARAVVLAAPPETSMPAPYGVFSGQARDALTGGPVAGALVSLKGAAKSVHTDAGGYFHLTAPPGEWEIGISARNYLTMSRVRQRVLAGRTLRVDFDLVLADPTPEQHEVLFHRLVMPPEQAMESGHDLALSAASVPSTIRVLMPDGLVIEMDVDEYLRGVVPSELPPYAPLESLKAQAIAARSYAVTSWNHATQGANVCTTTHCQVWKDHRFSRTDQAVSETKGMVATHSGRIIRAFYFGHCDGHTRNSEDVWIQALPYCRSVPCICGFNWMWGHGVGMCQEGAMEMARQGASFAQILRHYYTGTSVLGYQPTPTPSPTVTPTATPDPVVTHSYPLQAGWNMISVPFPVTQSTTSELLASIAGAYDLVMQYDAFEANARWKVYDATAATQTGGLDSVDTRYGIWLRATQPCTLTISGLRAMTTTEVPLNIGLNLVGYPLLQTGPISVALSSILGKYVRVYTYHTEQSGSQWLMYDFTTPDEINTLTEMTPGCAYWIEMVQPATWLVKP